MDELSMDQTLDHDFQQKKKNPVFLIVLCIISWVENGLGIFNGLKDLAATGFQNNGSNIGDILEDEELENLDDLDGFIDVGTDFEMITDQVYYQSWISLIGGILICIFVFMMFKRKKAGFIPYVITKALIIIASIYLAAVYSGSGSLFSGMMMGAIAFSVIHHGVFIVLFSMNRKHLTE